MKNPRGLNVGAFCAFCTTFLFMVIAGLGVSFQGEGQGRGPAEGRPADEGIPEPPSMQDDTIRSQAERETGDRRKVVAELSTEELDHIARVESSPALIPHKLPDRWEDRAGKEITLGPAAISGEKKTTVRGEGETGSKVASDPEPIELELESVVTEAVVGEPMGAGRIELRFIPGHGPILYPDQPLFLGCKDGRALYSAFKVNYEEPQGQSPWRAASVEASFLIRGDAPLEVSLSSLDEVLIEDHEIHVEDHHGRHRSLTQHWWQRFSIVPEDLDRKQKRLHQTLLDLLARRHGMPGPWPATGKQVQKKTTSLESQFERAVSMLFGMESVKLAMQDDVRLDESTRFQEADQSLPAMRPLNAIDIPEFHDGWIEPIAMHVPEECFYLRTGSVANYRYFRQLLTGWGGSLDDIVTTGSLEHQARRKVEIQLGLNSQRLTSERIDKLISDMALIGCDPLFTEGAAIGLLLRARGDGHALAEEFKQQRARVRSAMSDVSERHIHVAGNDVAFLSTADHRVRSFYAIDGEYHLITNSRYLLDRFFESGRGDRSLGQLREFRYSRSQSRAKSDAVAFLYLSDPFFRNLVSPHYRIEMTRRHRAEAELQQLRLARLAARAEKVEWTTIDDLIQAHYLPRGFASRADGSWPTIREGRSQDSLRGMPGTFLPVPDVPIDKATRAEILAYHRFMVDYSQQWGRVDPVTVIFSRRQGIDAERLDRVQLDIIVTPFARQRYAKLEQYLVPFPERQLVFPIRDPSDPAWLAPGDLLNVSASVRRLQGYPSHQVVIGLRDDVVPFVIKGGSVKLVDQDDESSYAATRSYAAISPPSMHILRTLASALLESPMALPAAPRARVSSNRSFSQPTPPPEALPAPLHALYYLGWAFSRVPGGVTGVSNHANLLDNRGSLTVVSRTPEIRDQTFDAISDNRMDGPHMVRMRMGPLSGSRVEPYIQAYTYMSARRISAENCRLLNHFTHWLDLPPETARQTFERILGAKLRCPLGGDYELNRFNPRTHWTGTAWESRSRFTLSETPQSWRFPFLDWLRGMDLTFDLQRPTLRAKVELAVRHTGGDATLVALPMSDPSPDQSSGENESGSILTSGPQDSARDWILGIRVATPDDLIRVRHVHAGSPASSAGIRTGDVVSRVNGQVPVSAPHLRQLVVEAQQVGLARIELTRRTRTLTLDVPLPPNRR